MRLTAAWPLLAVLPFAGAPQPSATRWPLASELMLAADACSYAPPDFKRQLAKHRQRLMNGVRDAAAAEKGTRDAAQHRAAAARGARAIVTMVRDHHPFSEIAYQSGGIVHEIAAALPYDGKPPASSRFLGFSADPFRDPETLAAAALPARGPQETYDAALTLATRLLTWTWKYAGGDARIAAQYPDAKGPYVVRE